MRFLNNDHLWPEIKKQAGQSKTLHAAVGYIGRNPLLVIKWPKKSVVIADLSENAVKRGSSSARGGLSLLKKGVKLYQLQALHAKIYVFDRVAIVCSANISESSENLYEAGILITEIKKVNEIKAYVLSSLIRNEDAFELNKKIIKSRVRFEPTRPPIPPKPPEWLSERIWVIPVKSNENTIKEVEKDKAKYIKKEIGSDKNIQWLYECGKYLYDNCKENDSIIFIWEKGKNFRKIEGPFNLKACVDLGEKYKNKIQRYNLALLIKSSKIKAISVNDLKYIRNLLEAKTINGHMRGTYFLKGKKRNKFKKWFEKLLKK